MNTLLILGIAHTIGDFLLQSDTMAKGKTNKWTMLLGHVLLYALTMCAVFFCAPTAQAWLAFAILSAAHALVDLARIHVAKGLCARGRLVSYCADQLLHLGTVVLVWALLLRGQSSAMLQSLSTRSWFRPTLLCGALCCLLWDPTAVLVRKVFELFQTPGTKKGDDVLARSGELIGKLERLIVAALVLCNAPTAIGFVLTAKSVARFKDMEQKGFAERYLVGTLLSVTVALIGAILVSKLL